MISENNNPKLRSVPKYLFALFLVSALFCNPIKLFAQQLGTFSFDAEIVDDLLVNAEMSAVLDDQNNTHIAWVEQDEDKSEVERRLMYTVFNGTSVSTTEVHYEGANSSIRAPNIVLDDNGNPHIVFGLQRDIEESVSITGNSAVMYAGDPEGDGTFEVSQVSVNPSDPTDDSDDKFNAEASSSIRPQISIEDGNIIIGYIAASSQLTSYDEYFILARPSGGDWDLSRAYNLDELENYNTFTDHPIVFPMRMSSLKHQVYKSEDPIYMYLDGSDWVENKITGFTTVFDGKDAGFANADDGYMYFTWHSEANDTTEFVLAKLDGESLVETRTFDTPNSPAGNLRPSSVDLSTGLFVGWHARTFSEESYLIVENADGTFTETVFENIGIAYGKRVISARDGFISLVTASEDEDKIYITTTGLGNGNGSDDDTIPPTTPASLSVSSTESGIELSWDDNSEDDLAGYNLYRSESSFSDVSSATKVNSSLITESPYTDDSVEEGVTYYYRATAVDTADNESDPSDIVEIESPSTPVAAPTNLTASSDSSGIKLSWDENSETDLEGYNVYRATQSFSSVSEANQLNESLLTEASFEDLNVTSVTTYYYAVTAVDQDQNESELSGLAEITFEDDNSGGDGGGDAILAEDFEDTQFPPTGWSTQTSISSELWFLFDHNDEGFEPADDQSRYSAMVEWVDEDHDEWLISPDFSLSETDNQVLVFDVYYDAVWVSYATMKLNIRTGQSDSEWTTLWEAEDDGTSNPQWRKVEVSLSDYAGTENVQLAWQYVGNDGYFMAIDNVEISTGETGSGNNLPIEVAANAQITFGEARTSQDYRLVALPGAVNENLAGLLSGDPNVDWQAYYDDGSEEDYLVKYDGSDTFTLEPGNGFWVTHKDSFSYQDTLSMVKFNSQDQATIPLHEGWNIISNPLDIDVAWSEITSVNGDSLQPAWGFDGSFSEASDFTSAKSGEAFYFLNDQGLDELVIPYVQTSSTEKKLSRKNQLSLLTFAEDNKTSSSSIIFTEKKQVDVVAPPDAFEGSSLRFVNKETSEDNRRTASLARIYREYQPQGQQFTMTLTAEPDQPVTIKVDGLDSYQVQELVILNPETGKSFDLLSSQSVTITPKEEATELLLLMGDSQFVGQQQDEFLPKQIEVNPNYPNPFNPTTTLRFSLPEQADVRVQVYDVLGRQVSTLVNEVREAGIHTVTFDASRQASGMYFAIFEIGQQRYVQKMMLIK